MRMNKDNIVIPVNVQMKADAAFSMIKTEGADVKTEKKKTRSTFKRPAFIVVAALVVLAIGTTAYAAANGFWSKSMENILPADESAIQTLEEAGYIANAEGSGAITQNGVTITPLDVICDGTYGYVVFEVEGFDSKGKEPMFSECYINIDEEGGVSASGKWNHELNSNGNHEFAWHFWKHTDDISLTGKTLHVGFEGLGVATGKADGVELVSGKWDFDIILPGCDDTRDIAVGKKIEGTDYTLDRIEISPLSVRSFYTFDGDGNSSKNELDIPGVHFVILADGTKVELMGGGTAGFTDADKINARQSTGNGKVLDPEMITAVMVSSVGNAVTIDLD